MNTKEKLRLVYEYYKKLASENDIMFSYAKFFDNYSAWVLNSHDGKEIRSKFYKFILNTFSYDKLPKVVSSKDYKSLDKIELYHGYIHYKHGAQYLKEKEIFDYGWIPSGFYVSADKYFSIGYSSDYTNKYKDSAKRVLPVKIDTDKICHFSYIKNIREKIQEGDFDNFPENDKDKIWELINFALTIEDESERLNFVNLFLENYSNLAILLGYDAMYGGFAGYDVDDIDYPDEIEVFNRGIVVVKESKYNWFMNKAEEEKQSQKQ